MRDILKAVIKAIYKALRGIYRLLPMPASLRNKIRNSVGRAAAKLQKTIGYEAPEVLHKYSYYKGIICENQRIITARDEKIAEYEEYTETVFQTGKKCNDFVEYKENSVTFTDEDVKPIACYLTQFHAIPENDEWWGKGFTEWTNATKSMPLFPGHYQPHLPLETFYDLSDIDVMKRQVELAKNYGIYGFLFHYYWFSGKRLLEKPLDNFLKTKDGLDFPFCISWANHSWTRIWDASEKDILIEQKHSEEDDLACIADISRYLVDDRYIRVNGKPFISIFNPELLPNPKRTIDIWRKYCRQHGIGEIHIVGMDNNLCNPLIYGFDGAIASSPNDIGQVYSDKLALVYESIDKFTSTKYALYDMEKYVCEEMYMKDNRDNFYRGIIPTFDNSARRSDIASVMSVSPRLYRKWLYDILQSSKKNFEKGNRFVFINAWNEWAEGAHLEPDRRYGYAYLQATADAIIDARNDDTGAVCYFDHDMGGGANQYLDGIVKNQTTISYIIRYDLSQEQYKIITVYKDDYVSMVSEFQDVEHFIEAKNITEIVLNNIVTFPNSLNILKRLINLKKRKDIKLSMHVHDYFSICPIFHLLDHNLKYCEVPELSVCECCYPISKEIMLPELRVETSIQEWRKSWKSFLCECDNIVTFSESSKSLLEAAHGEFTQIEVVPHTVEYIQKVNKMPKRTETLNIGILGDIINHKGASILRDMVNIATAESRYGNIRFVLLGAVHPPIESDVLTDLGNYKKENLPDLTVENDIDIYIIPSICPETFSYATQEVIEMDMPIACFNLGAQAERVRSYNNGVIIPEITVKCALETIVGWYSSAEMT